MKSTITFLSILLAMSLVFNVRQWYQSEPIVTGGGQYKISPNQQFTANAGSRTDLNSLRPDYNIVWAELDISSTETSTPLIALQLRPAGVEQPMDYRDLDEPITWSEDSKTAIFTLPNAIVSVTPITKPKLPTLSVADVVNLATAKATEVNEELGRYEMVPPRYSHADNSWLVLFTPKAPSFPGDHFSISVDDESTEATIIPGE